MSLVGVSARCSIRVGQIPFGGSFGMGVYVLVVRVALYIDIITSVAQRIGSLGVWGGSPGNHKVVKQTTSFTNWAWR